MRVAVAVFAEASGGPKRQLSAGFTPEESKSLSAAMLEDVLNALKSSVVSEVAVIGSGSSVRRASDKFGVSFISKEHASLASAVQKAIEWCTGKKADAVLLLPANVPLVSSNDINRIVEIGLEAPSVVLSPSMTGGANAVFLNPPNLMEAAFGPDSFFKLVKEAVDENVVLRFYSSRGITLDVNSEEDLCKLFELKNNSLSKRVFDKIRQRRNKKS